MKTDPFESGVLDRTVHERLVADLAGIAADANIQPRWVYTPLGEVCKPPEVAWVKKFPFHAQIGRAGFCYEGRNPDPDIETRMSAIAGALTRNFIHARVMTLGDVITDIDAGDPPMMTCLLIPNFFVEKAQGGVQAAWRVTLLLDLLVNRHAAGLQTVLYASDVTSLGTEYGAALKRHVVALYEIFEV